MKVQSLTVFAAELRTPIGALRNAVNVLESARSLPGAMDRAQRVIARQVGRLALLAEDLLDLASITEGTLSLRREWIDVVPEVRAAVEASAWALAGNGHSLCFEMPDGPLRARVDGPRLRQVITNLLDNAREQTDTMSRIRLSLQQIGDRVVCSVEDSGAAIASDQLPHVFDGSVIGLALVRGIVELHGGDVRASSAGPGQGSVFVVRLPVDPFA